MRHQTSVANKYRQRLIPSDGIKIISGNSLEICQHSGTYKCSIHQGFTIELLKGHRFPACDMGPVEGHGAAWIFINDNFHGETEGSK